jgi:L-ascorbate metabolism protein UlaG (beta-lactamase superfamily)
MRLLFFLLWLTIFSHCDVMAHQASVTYVANEAVLITSRDKKVLFDPFFHQAFGTYQLVPLETQQAIFSSTPPFDDLTAIVISHAHDDHFDAKDVLKYLQKKSEYSVNCATASGRRTECCGWGKTYNASSDQCYINL